MTTLRLILGDQLSDSISSLSGCQKEKDMVMMCEVLREATYVKHHKKKLVLVLSAMRHFANAVSEQGYQLHYVHMNDSKNTQSFEKEVARAVSMFNVTELVVTHPGEYRVLQNLLSLESSLGIKVIVKEDTRFMCTIDEFKEWASGRKQLRMEYFYREMRKKHAILMDDNNPVGGQWNFDADNRKPPKSGLSIPKRYQSKPDAITQEVMTLVRDEFGDHFGDLDDFHFAVTRDQALIALKQFIEKRLVLFGDYQDAMLENEPWMYHAHISFYLNIGLLLPGECIAAVESAYRSGSAPLNAVEGFVRQVLGWREYVRGIYWLKMPEYADLNFFEATRALPEFYWTAETKMNCLKQCVTDTKKHAYAHHIQRLMVLGNFALLAGLDPKEVNEWYLMVYADAFEWVELPNVSGMILFADGGMLGSKPYAAGGNYINKMSNYCDNCGYKVKQKQGEDACPFNYLYWNFLARHRDLLGKNQRLAMIYRTYDRMSDEKKAAILEDSRLFFESL